MMATLTQSYENQRLVASKDDKNSALGPLGCAIPCKTGHPFTGVRCRRDDSALQCFARATDTHLLVLDDDLVDQQPDIGLTQGGVITAQPIAQKASEPAKDLRRKRALTGLQLAFESFDICRHRSDAASMMGQPLGKVAFRR